jgi:hypothetical protein
LVKAKTLTLRGAELKAVSYRHAKPLWRRYGADGAESLKSRAAGQPSNRRSDASTRSRALALIPEKYGGRIAERFGPTLAAEHLATEDGALGPHETLRRWMLAAGLWSRARQRSGASPPARAQSAFGDLVQLDGSFHRVRRRRAKQPFTDVGR